MKRMLVLGLLTVIALTGCTTVPREVQSGIPEDFDTGGVDVLLEAQPIGAWIEDRSRFAVVTFGSSSCVPVPVSLTAPDRTTIALTFSQPAALVCTADLTATTQIFDTPDGVDTSGEVRVEVLFDYDPDATYSFVLDD